MPVRLRSAAAIGLVVVLFVGLVASVADARGGGSGAAGGRMGGGAKRGKKGAKANAQVEQIIHDTYRRDLVNRSRFVGW